MPLIAFTFWKVLGGCFQLAVATFLAIVVVAVVIQRVNLYRFKRRLRGKWLLVAGTRHGWYDFIRNNVAPVLPADTALVQGPRIDASVVIALYRLQARGSRPLLVHVTPSGEIKHVSLHEQLLPLRHRAARDPEVQREVAAVIAGQRARLISQ